LIQMDASGYDGPPYKGRYVDATEALNRARGGNLGQKAP
jgi:hypothetical protein